MIKPPVLLPKDDNIKFEDFVNCPALFSGNYRYWLRRRLWDADKKELISDRKLLAIMMNPSTADHETNDPTTRIMLGFALRWGFGHYAAVNVRALIEPYSTKLTNNLDEVGPHNIDVIKEALKWIDEGWDNRIITAWGSHPLLKPQVDEVKELLKGRTLLRFGVNKDGSPRFPRAISRDTRPEEWKIE